MMDTLFYILEAAENPMVREEQQQAAALVAGSRLELEVPFADVTRKGMVLDS
jgi:hypothetical protein